MSDYRDRDKEIRKQGARPGTTGDRRPLRESADRQRNASGRPSTAGSEGPGRRVRTERSSDPDRRVRPERTAGSGRRAGTEHSPHADRRPRPEHDMNTGRRPEHAHQTGSSRAASPDRNASFPQKFKRVCRLLWREYRFETVAVAVLIIAIAIAVPLIVGAVRKNKTPAPQANPEEYGDLFAENGEVTTKATTNAEGIRIRVDEATGEEVEDPTILAEKKNTKDGYLKNCVFLGDSRTVAMVSYGFISDEDALAQVGIAHTSVEGYTFTQNSGKQYTVKSYLAARKPQVIYIGYGVNGMNGMDEDTYQKTYKTLIEHIMEMSPESKIVLMAIWPVDDNGTYRNSVKNEWIDKYNEFLLTLAEYEGLYYLDVDTVLKDSKGSIKKEYDGGDGLHYKATAYNVIIKYIITHPVPGISDDGEYVVHYVAPRGQYKDMIKDKEGMPSVAATPTPKAEHVHEWVEEIITKATCTEPGLKRLTCSCGAMTEKEIPALGHKFGDDGEAEYCTRCGERNPNYKEKEKPKPTKEPSEEDTNEEEPAPTSKVEESTDDDTETDTEETTAPTEESTEPTESSSEEEQPAPTGGGEESSGE